MVRDYANRPSTRKQRRQRQQRRRRLLGSVIVIVAALLLSSVLYYIKYRRFVQQHPRVKPTIPLQNKAATADTTVKHSTAPPTPAEPPKFDFYTMLPNMRVSTAQTVPVAEVPEGHHFILQVASLKNPDDAQRLKERLAILGFMATVRPYRSQSSQIVWHRVLTGPYDDAEAAQRAQDRLLHSGIESILLRSR